MMKITTVWEIGVHNRTLTNSIHSSLGYVAVLQNILVSMYRF